MAKREKRGGLRGTMDKMTDTVGGMVGKTAAATVTDARSFVEKAAIGDMYEVEAARIALQRSRAAPVLTMAQMMLDDHTTSTHQMMSALRSSEVTRPHGGLMPPTDLDTRRRGMIDHLRNAADDEFDQRYLDQQEMAHSETETLLSGYGDSGDNPQLQSVARSALPMVQRHRAMVSRMLQQRL
jgi:putative membrane protein